MDAWQGVKYSSCKCMHALGGGLGGQHQCSPDRATLQFLANITRQHPSHRSGSRASWRWATRARHLNGNLIDQCNNGMAAVQVHPHNRRLTSRSALTPAAQACGHAGFLVRTQVSGDFMGTPSAARPWVPCSLQVGAHFYGDSTLC